MPGAAATVAEAMGGGLLRVVDCNLAESAEEHFVDVQREVWAPAMAAAGVLGGILARFDGRRYLVATLWPDAETHHRYTEEVPRPRTFTATGITSMTGHVLVLEPTWRVRAIR